MQVVTQAPSFDDAALELLDALLDEEDEATLEDATLLDEVDEATDEATDELLLDATLLVLDDEVVVAAYEHQAAVVKLLLG
ncbi:hypothetical protein GCM10025770_25010 [Viridibacterium curvum]|uniref:Uncharacterized protein n=1 Tax=Viridibacterium curvum TaxID=1101404 RepID=A0ABP9QTG4_9RHOO